MATVLDYLNRRGVLIHYDEVAQVLSSCNLGDLPLVARYDLTCSLTTVSSRDEMERLCDDYLGTFLDANPDEPLRVTRPMFETSS